MQTHAHISPHRVLEFVQQLFDPILHSKRIASLADATIGVLRGTSLAIHAIGAGLAVAKGLNSKYATKQVDRLLSNKALDPDHVSVAWVSFVLAQRTDLVLALDWTDFDGDSHSTLSLSVLTTHGRSTPLLWQTVPKSALKNRKNLVEDALLRKLRDREECLKVLSDRKSVV